MRSPPNFSLHAISPTSGEKLMNWHATFRERGNEIDLHPDENGSIEIQFDAEAARKNVTITPSVGRLVLSLQEKVSLVDRRQTPSRLPD